MRISLCFADGYALYSGQFIGVVLAESKPQAEIGAALVAVQYEKDEEKAIVSSVDQILDEEKQAAGRMALKNELSCDEDIEALLKADKYYMNEIVKIGTQTHLFMESHAAYVVPDEERRLMVYTGTQCCTQRMAGYFQIYSVSLLLFL